MNEVGNSLAVRDPMRTVNEIVWFSFVSDGALAHGRGVAIDAGTNIKRNVGELFVCGARGCPYFIV